MASSSGLVGREEIPGVRLYGPLGVKLGAATDILAADDNVFQEPVPRPLRLGHGAHHPRHPRRGL
eukprot:12714101-Alexandrium_andersonii.AAC.1